MDEQCLERTTNFRNMSFPASIWGIWKAAVEYLCLSARAQPPYCMVFQNHKIKQNKTEVCQGVLTAVNTATELKPSASILYTLALTSKAFFIHSCQHLQSRMKEEALMRKRMEQQEKGKQMEAEYIQCLVQCLMHSRPSIVIC